VSAAQWVALAERCYYWANPGLNDPDVASEHDEFEQWETSPMGHRSIRELGPSLAGLALFAKLMALVEREERFTGETDPLGPGDFANGNADDHEGFFRMSGRFLFDALRNVWRGADRGELRALLVEAWGPSPAMSDLRGLAARESAGPCLDPDKMHGAADGFGGSDY